MIENKKRNSKATNQVLKHEVRIGHRRLEFGRSFHENRGQREILRFIEFSRPQPIRRLIVEW